MPNKNINENNRGPFGGIKHLWQKVAQSRKAPEGTHTVL